MWPTSKYENCLISVLAHTPCDISASAFQHPLIQIVGQTIPVCPSDVCLPTSIPNTPTQSTPLTPPRNARLASSSSTSDIPPPPHPIHRYFFPAAKTLARNTGLFTSPIGPPNGLITALTQASKTSLKNNRIASSVCWLVGLFAIPPLPAPLATFAREERDEFVVDDDVVVVEVDSEGPPRVPGKAFV